MTDHKKINAEIRKSILEYLNQQMNNPECTATPLAVAITETCVNNKTEESGRSGVLAENENGPHFIKGHEPLLSQKYHIPATNDQWSSAEWWETCTNPPDALDIALALAAEHLRDKGEEAPSVFDNRKLAILHYLPRLKNEPEEDFCGHVANLLQILDHI